MKILVSLAITLLLLIACNNTNRYPKEVCTILKVHGGVKAWKNVKTVSFTLGKEVFTIDMASGKKVIHAPNYSLGFNGVSYWLAQRGHSFGKNPKGYITAITDTFLVPFLLTNVGRLEIDKEKSIITFREREKIHFDTKKYHIQSFLLRDQFRRYQQWQDVLGFRLPKVVQMGDEELQFSSVLLSQVTFADSFYEKPINQ